MYCAQSQVTWVPSPYAIMPYQFMMTSYHPPCHPPPYHPQYYPPCHPPPRFLPCPSHYVLETRFVTNPQQQMSQQPAPNQVQAQRNVVESQFETPQSNHVPRRRTRRRRRQGRQVALYCKMSNPRGSGKGEYIDNDFSMKINFFNFSFPNETAAPRKMDENGAVKDLREKCESKLLAQFYFRKVKFSCFVVIVELKTKQVTIKPETSIKIKIEVN